MSDAFAGKENAAVVVGMGALAHEGAYEAARAAAAALGATASIVLHTAAARVGALDIGFTTDGGIEAIRARAGELKPLFLLGVDETDISAFADTFTIYIGTHGDRGVRHADVILPAAAYTEKHGTYVNLEGRVQRRRIRAVHPAGRGAGGLDDLPRAVRRARQDAAVRRPRRSSAPPSRCDVPRLGTLGLSEVDPLPKPKGRAPKLSGGDRLSDRGFLPDQPDRASPADDAALLGRDPPRPDLRGGRGMTIWFQSWAGQDFGWFLATLVGILLIALPLMLAVAMIIYADRKIWAAMALRRGPNVVGPFGLLQSFADGLKVFLQGDDHPVGGQSRPVPASRRSSPSPWR